MAILARQFLRFAAYCFNIPLSRVQADEAATACKLRAVLSRVRVAVRVQVRRTKRPQPASYEPSDVRPRLVRGVALASGVRRNDDEERPMSLLVASTLCSVVDFAASPF